MPEGGPSALDAAAVGAQATYGTLFANSEFRALWLAQILSVLGDQLARVALTVLVYDRTRSPLVAGFAGGGTIVGFFGVRPSLLADAATFAVSALVTSLRVRPRPAARPASSAPDGPAATGTGPAETAAGTSTRPARYGALDGV